MDFRFADVRAAVRNTGGQVPALFVAILVLGARVAVELISQCWRLVGNPRNRLLRGEPRVVKLQ